MRSAHSSAHAAVLLVIPALFRGYVTICVGEDSIQAGAGSRNQPSKFLYRFSPLKDAPHLVIRQRRADALCSRISLVCEDIVAFKSE